MAEETQQIRTDSEEFKRAVARGDRKQIEEWDSEGLIEWDPRNFAGRQMSELAQKAKKQLDEVTKRTEGGDPPPAPPSRLDQMGVGKTERLWSGHALVQRAIRQGDSILLAEIYADDRYDSAVATGPDGAFTSGDIESYMARRSAS